MTRPDEQGRSWCYEHDPHPMIMKSDGKMVPANKRQIEPDSLFKVGDLTDHRKY